MILIITSYITFHCMCSSLPVCMCVCLFVCEGDPEYEHKVQWCVPSRPHLGEAHTSSNYHKPLHLPNFTLTIILTTPQSTIIYSIFANSNFFRSLRPCPILTFTISYLFINLRPSSIATLT